MLKCSAMRLLILLPFSFLFSIVSFGQDSIVESFFTPATMSHGQDSLIRTLTTPVTTTHIDLSYKGSCNFIINDNTNDTLFLKTLHHSPFGGGCESKLIDSIQIDGIGAKEVVIYRKHNDSEERHGGSYDISTTTRLEKYEVWNVDSHQLLFQSTSYFFYNCANFNAYTEPSHTKGSCSYRSDFKIDKTGTITIKGLKQRNNIKGTYSKKSVGLDYCQPLDNEGLYQFIDNKYQKVE